MYFVLSKQLFPLPKQCKTWVTLTELNTHTVWKPTSKNLGTILSKHYVTQNQPISREHCVSRKYSLTVYTWRQQSILNRHFLQEKSKTIFKLVTLSTFCLAVVQSLSCVWLFATPWTAAPQASLSFTTSRSLLKLMPIELMVPSNHLVLHFSLLPCLQSFPASGSFPMSQLFASGGQTIRSSTSASAPPLYIQHWFVYDWLIWYPCRSRDSQRVFSSTRIQKHKFFSAQPSLLSNSHTHTSLLNNQSFDNTDCQSDVSAF